MHVGHRWTLMTDFYFQSSYHLHFPAPPIIYGLCWGPLTQIFFFSIVHNGSRYRPFWLQCVALGKDTLHMLANESCVQLNVDWLGLTAFKPVFVGRTLYNVKRSIPSTQLYRPTKCRTKCLKGNWVFSTMSCLVECWFEKISRREAVSVNGIIGCSGI